MQVPRCLPLFLVLAACAPSVPGSPSTPPPEAGSAQPPAAGAVATSVLHESPTAVSRIMRLAPGAQIPEHHHPAHDETFFVHQGTVTAVLNGQEHTVRAGGLVHIPAGTVIVGRNPGSEEAVVVVVFSSNGTGGPLTVAGRPHH